MRLQNQQNSAANYYLGVLNNLSAEIKLDLIAQLSQSVKQERTTTEPALSTLFGAYREGESAEEIIAEIRSSRVANRNIEPL